MLTFSKARKYFFSLCSLMLALMLFPMASVYAAYETLRPGDKNDAVKQMQQALTDIGFDTNGIDGKYGSGTILAVTAFQRSERLKDDGIAGNTTLTALYKKASSSSSSSALREGAIGQEVSKLQQKLKDLGYDISSVDGKYGPSTLRAVKAFQRKNNLKADGVAGSNTLNLLYSGSAIGPGSPSSSGPSGGSSSSGTLRFGDMGAEVTKMQQALTALGYDTNGTEGKYGKGTQRAVRLFQQKNNLKIDGIAGSSTLARLYSGNSTANGSSSGGSGSTTTGTLRFGDSGSAVKEMQQALNKLGYNTNGADGKYGNGTRNAVKSFQRANRLTADGIAGNNTLTKLFSLSSGSSGSGSGSSGGDGTTFTRTLRKGYTGNDVTAVQKRLVILNYLSSASGTYDDNTIAAAKAFQKRNGLSADGLIGKNSFSKLFSSSAKENSSGSGSSGSGPSSGAVQLLHWYNDVKPSIRSGQTYYVYHDKSGMGWNMKFYSLGRHADSEPLTASDTAAMNKAFGKTSWDPIAVKVKLPNGKWTLATMHNTPHLNGSIKDNDFKGHLCVHFLRDMSETEKNDPNYGVTNQKALRKAWKALTGQDYVEKY